MAAVRHTLMAGLLAAAAFSAACGPAGDPEAKRRIAPVYDPQTGKLTELKYDANGDGQADTWSYMDGSRVLRIEIDKNQDGKVERWEYYGTDGSMERLGLSRSDTGTIDRLEFYVHGALVRAEDDSNGDGRMDKWETYEGSRLVSVAFDTTFRGSPDRRLMYGADGTVRLEVDPEGSGHFVLATR